MWGLFNGAAGSSDYIASNDRMMLDWRTGNEVEAVLEFVWCLPNTDNSTKRSDTAFDELLSTLNNFRPNYLT